MLHKLYRDEFGRIWSPWNCSICRLLTDNNNRTVANVRSYFSKCEGSLGTNGSLEFIFDRKGVFTIDSKQANNGFRRVGNGTN